MLRKALLIGNTGGLPGVKQDLKKTRTFLESDVGGNWLPSEIVELTNPSRDKLLVNLELLKNQSVDFAFVLFSGHGGHVRETVLELNPDNETISESVLCNLAQRQITIYDCCRVLIEERLEKSNMMFLMTAPPARNDDLRARYEARVMQAIPQQVRLYACSVSQYAYDFGKGAVYLGHLLDSARAIEANESFKTVERVQEQAYQLTVKTAESKGHLQQPDAVLPKCLTQQQLILAIRP